MSSVYPYVLRLIPYMIYYFIFARACCTDRIETPVRNGYDMRQVVGDFDVLGFCAWRRHGGSPTVREDGGLEGRDCSHARVSCFPVYVELVDLS